MSGLPAMRPGPRNAITDVAGVLVGHYQRLEQGWATGSTVVLAPAGATGGVDGRGGAPGTRETDLLDPSNLVQRVHGVSLSGGSAYGLAAADGVMRWLGERGHGFAVGARPEQVVPIVPAAVLFDLPVSDWGNRPDAEFGYAACAAAGPDCAVGSVGAGTGATIGSLSGGVGTASAVLTGGTVFSGGTVVGALAVANAYGEGVDLATGRPYGLDAELDGEFGLRVPGTPAELDQAAGARLNTTIGVVATDAALDKAECRRVASAAQDGLARALRPAHSMFDGDTVFALATGEQPEHAAESTFAGPGRAALLDAICFAAAEAFTRAIVHGMLRATGLPGFPGYRQVWPNAIAEAE